MEVLGREKTHAYKTYGDDDGHDNNNVDENSSPRGKRKQRRKVSKNTAATTNPSSSNHYHSSDDDDDYANDHDGKEEIQDRHAFFRVVLNLQKSGEKVNALTYEFPFEVHLPSSLPSSCEYKDEENDGGGFSIEVRVESNPQQKAAFSV